MALDDFLTRKVALSIEDTPEDKIRLQNLLDKLTTMDYTWIGGQPLLSYPMNHLIIECQKPDSHLIVWEIAKKKLCLWRAEDPMIIIPIGKLYTEIELQAEAKEEDLSISLSEE